MVFLSQTLQNASRSRVFRRWRFRWHGWVLSWILLSICGCKQTESKAGPVYADRPSAEVGNVYRILVHPLHSQDQLAKFYAPLARYLESKVGGAHIEVESSRDFADFEARIRTREADFLIPNSLQTLWAIDSFGYRVLCQAGTEKDFVGLVLVGRDSPIRKIQDLRGKRVAYPSRTALAACILQQKMFHDSGLDVVRGLDNRYVGSQESAIQNAAAGFVDAACTWPQAWRAFQRQDSASAARLRVQWTTSPMVTNSILARNDVPDPVREGVRSALLGLAGDSVGRGILEAGRIEGFHPANDSTYLPVRNLVREFELHVRKVRD